MDDLLRCQECMEGASRKLGKLCRDMENANILATNKQNPVNSLSSVQLLSDLCSLALPVIAEAFYCMEPFIGVASKSQRNSKNKKLDVTEIFRGIPPYNWQRSTCIALFEAFKTFDKSSLKAEEAILTFRISVDETIELSFLKIYHLGLNVKAMYSVFLYPMSNSSEDDNYIEANDSQKFDITTVRITWAMTNRTLAKHYSPTIGCNNSLRKECSATSGSAKTSSDKLLRPIAKVSATSVITKSMPKEVKQQPKSGINLRLPSDEKRDSEGSTASDFELSHQASTVRPRLFISYSWSHRATEVRELAKRLKDQFPVWLDNERSSDTKGERMIEGIRWADIVLVFFCDVSTLEGSISCNQLVFAQQERKKMLFVRLQSNYEPNKQLAEMIGNQSWIEFGVAVSNLESLCKRINLVYETEESTTVSDNPKPALLLGDESKLANYVERLELKKIRDRTRQLCKQDTGILLIHGPGGIGKTTLVRHALTSSFLGTCDVAVRAWLSVYELSKSFDDESFYKALADLFVIKVGQHEFRKSVVQQEIRSITGKVLLILDDVYDNKIALCAKTLGQNVRIICISRVRLSLAKYGLLDEPVLSVGRMSNDDIKAMFRDCQNSVAPRDLKEIAKRCNGIPLVAQVIRSHLGKSPQSAKRYIRKLDKHFPDLIINDEYDDEKKQKTISKLLLIGFKEETPEFRRRYYFFLLFERGANVELEDLAIFWQCNAKRPCEEALEFCETFIDKSLLQSDQDNREFSIHDYLYGAALEFACSDETSNSDITDGLKHFSENGSGLLQHLRENILRSVMDNQTAENILHLAVKARRQKLVQVIIDIVTADSQAELLFILCDRQSFMSCGSRLPLHMLLEASWLKNELDFGLATACFLVHQLLQRQKQKALEIVQIQNTADNKSILDLLLDLSPTECCTTWRRNALLLAAGNGYRQLLELLLDNGASRECRDVDGNNLVLVATQNGQANVVSDLLQRFEDLDVNASDKTGRTALMTAAYNGYTYSCKFLLASKNGIDIDKQDMKGNTALILAAKNGRYYTARLLLKSGANVDIRNSTGDSALWLAKFNNYTQTASLIKKTGGKLRDDENVILCRLKSKDHAKQLKYSQMAEVLVKVLALEKLAFPDSSEGNCEGYLACICNDDKKGAADERQKLMLTIPGHIDEIALFMAAYFGNSESIEYLLDVIKVDGIANNDAKTPLHFASQNGHAKVVEMLINRRAGVNARQRDGWTALHYASRSGHSEVVRLLIANGAEINAKESQEWTPLHAAACNGHQEVVAMLLETDIEIDAKQKDGCTALHIACRNNRRAVAELLIEQLKEVNTKDRHGWTSLHYAADHGHIDVIRLLIKSGADVNAEDNDGLTPLHLASNNDCREAAEVLVANNAELASNSKDGKLPLDIAYENKKWDVFEFLRERRLTPRGEGQPPRFHVLL